MQIPEDNAWFDCSNRSKICIEDDFINLSLALGKFSSDRKGTCNITGIMKFRFTTGINNQHPAY